MALLFNIIDEKAKQKYIEKGNVCKTHVQQGISPEKYRIPNNSKASATYLWSNLLQVAPCMDGHTFIITFIPQSNPNIIVRARFSNHPCGGRKNWDKYETIGEPNKRVDIYFFNQTDNNTPVDGYENNLINNSHIYNDDDITKLCAALTNFFTTGIFIHPFVNSTSIQENKQYRNTNTEMKKQTIKLNESQLRKIIKESVKKVLNESERYEIFTLNIFDIENENSIDDMQYTRNYESADEAIQAAREVAQKYADYDSVINVFVMAGEYTDENGNIFGEPDAIYCISNKDKRTTMIARKNAGYSFLESDEYIG